MVNNFSRIPSLSGIYRLYALSIISCILFLSFSISASETLKPGRKGKQSSRNSSITPTTASPLYKQYKGDSADVSRLIESLMDGYDKRLRPNYKGDPVNVGITMHVSSVSSLAEVNMDFTVDFYFRQHWKDDRLAFNSSQDELCISNEMLDKIWWPDTFFANAKSASFHPATTKNAFLRIKADGGVTQSLRLTVTAMCPMELALFPLDTQVCSLEIESYAYSVKHITYRWKDGPIKSISLASNMLLPQFKVRGYKLYEKTETQSTGNYSRLAAHLWFVRDLGYYIIHLYIPSSLLVILSWISFWLHANAVPARVALGIMTVLTMTTLISSTNSSLPKISYLKSIDVYLVTAFFMVFAALLEYAAVSYLGNVELKPNKEEGKKLSAVSRALRAAEGLWPRRRRRGEAHRRSRTHSGERLPLDCERVNLSFQADAISSRTAAMLQFLEANHCQIPIELQQSRCRRHPMGCPLDADGFYENGRFYPLSTSRKNRMTNVTRLIPDVANSSPIKTPSKSGKGPAVKDGKAEGGKEAPPKYPYTKVSEAIDRYSRAVFPAAFFIFNVTYWTYYIHVSQSQTLTDFTEII